MMKCNETAHVKSDGMQRIVASRDGMQHRVTAVSRCGAVSPFDEEPRFEDESPIDASTAADGTWMLSRSWVSWESGGSDSKTTGFTEITRICAGGKRTLKGHVSRDRGRRDHVGTWTHGHGKHERNARVTSACLIRLNDELVEVMPRLEPLHALREPGRRTDSRHLFRTIRASVRFVRFIRFVRFALHARVREALWGRTTQAHTERNSRE